MSIATDLADRLDRWADIGVTEGRASVLRAAAAELRRLVDVTVSHNLETCDEVLRLRAEVERLTGRHCERCRCGRGEE